MRKYQQKKILELIKTLFEVTDEIKKFFSHRDFLAITQLLADCQEFVDRIHSFVLGVSDENAKTVLLLEKLYEDLYTYSIEISDAHPTNAFIKRLRKSIIDIEDNVKIEFVPNTIEVVFFPYKVSMWDSLESIWLAAKEDPNCDAYVVPIPYYEKDSRGTFGVMHYEADLYPDYVPIANWQDYDVSERRPDIVFIHNPYDNNNHVTSVHPDFYSSRLKDLTDLLVYVPYFVQNSMIKKEFCLTPACLNANKVIVGSEKERSIYVKHFKNAFGAQFGKPEEKFLALGSPKLDKINGLGEYELLPAWKYLIKNDDGEQKKIFLYNTSVSTMLLYNEQYLKKLRSVFAEFKHRNDALLWWRPHPLSMSTYQTLRPELAEEYVEIVDEFKNAGFGIYDDTSELHRAIACSDAYYGDGSSLVEMYKMTKKPIMISNPKTIRSEIRIFPNCVFVDENYIWMLNSYLKSTFKLSRRDRSVEHVDISLPENGWMPLPVKKDNFIYFPPLKADNIVICSEEEKSFREIPFKTIKLKENAYGSFYTAVAYDRYVYFTPARYPAIMRLDTLTDEVTYYSDWVEPLSKLTNDPIEAFFFQPLIVGSSIWLASCCSNAVVEFDMETLKSKVYKVGKKENQYIGLCFDGENFWLNPIHDTNLVKWNNLTGETAEFKLDNKGARYAFLQPIYKGGYVWVLPCFSAHAYKIDPRTLNISIADEFESVCMYGDNLPDKGNYSFACEIDEKIYAVHNGSSRVVELDFAENKCNEYLAEYSSEHKSKFESLVTNVYRNNPPPQESGFYSEWDFNQLSGFINYVTEGQGGADENSIFNPKPGAYKNVGYEIYNYVKSFSL